MIGLARTLNSFLNTTNLNPAARVECTNAGGHLAGPGCSTPEYFPDIFFFSILLFVFTFFICMGLQEFRHSSFFPTKVNKNLYNLYYIYIAFTKTFRFDQLLVILLF